MMRFNSKERFEKMRIQDCEDYSELHSKYADREQQIEDLEAGVRSLKNDHFKAKTIFLIIVGVAIFCGILTYSEIDGTIDTKIQNFISERINPVIKEAKNAAKNVTSAVVSANAVTKKSKGTIDEIIALENQIKRSATASVAKFPANEWVNILSCPLNFILVVVQCI